MTDQPLRPFDKLRISLRYLLQGSAERDAAYLVPLRAFEFASTTHLGTRKDGKTPEFMHQLEVALYTRTLSRNLQFPAESIATALLHDIVEDYGVTIADIESQFNDTVASAVQRMTKEENGIRRSDEDYFDKIAACPIASIVKGSDRINNQQTMIGVFRMEKQQEYISESEKFILPMLKLARRRFPQQEAAYENIKLMLRSQIQMLRAVHAELD